jgi:uncharacterized protein YkwD
MFSSTHKFQIRLALFILCFLSLNSIYWAAARPTAATAPDPAKAAEMLTEINNWRLQQGVWPLKVNPILQRMAEDHAIYLADMPQFPSDYSLIHADAQGRSPGERAIAEPYNWPKYMPISQAAIGENAALGSVRSGMNFWRNSDIHTRASLNPGYREVGVGAVKDGSDYIFIVVFGSRPNVFPATYDPATGLLYLTNEQFRWAPNSNAIKTVTEIRLFNAEGQPLSTDWQPWSPSLQVPEGVGSRLFILLSDGTQNTLTEVILSGDQPGQAAPTGNPAVAIAPTTAPASGGGASFSFGATAQPTTPPQPTAVPTTVPLVFATPAPNVASAEVALLYDARSLFLVNISSGPVNMSGISLVSPTRTLTLERWAQFAGNLSLSAYPAGHCLQAEQTGTNASSPPACRSVRSMIEYPPGPMFWSSGPFTVMRGSQTLATCDPAAGRCEVDVG